MVQTPADYLTPASVAKLTGLTPRAVVWNADRGYLRVAARTENGRRLFERRDVERFIAERAKRGR